jgi:3' terminal RNA ribose 2'-O-methyltransferase Hen1
MLRKLFEPLGYAVHAERLPYDETFPAWGDSPYFGVRLEVLSPLARVLAQLSVLLPVLDDDKHYWIGDAEVDKLLQRGGDWLAAHPHKDIIARRYLKHRESLTRQALKRLEESDFSSDGDDGPQDAGDEEAATPQTTKEAAEAALEKPLSLNQRRIHAVLEKIGALGAASVVDVGCGEGKLLAELARKKSLEKIVGMDVSSRALEIAERRLDRLPPLQKKRITLLHGSLTYRDKRLSGLDVATCVEVVEHLDPARVGALTRTLFEFARPKTVILTTPNREYNALFAAMPPGALRHADHRFEWTRDEFRAWAEAAAARHGYRVMIEGIGEPDAALGAPTQMAVFERETEGAGS